MDMSFEVSQADGYTSNSQKARVLTESWMAKNMFCPKCGNPHIKHFENNRPVADFYCDSCRNEYELKSKNGKFGGVIADAAYDTMIARISSNENPNFLFMNYSMSASAVTDLYFVPKHFFHSVRY